MKTVGILALALLALCAGVAVTRAAPDGIERHSGTVVTIDQLRDLIIVAEIESWDPATERARVTRHHIYVTGLTDFKVFTRTTRLGGYRGDGALVALSVVVADTP